MQRIIFSWVSAVNSAGHLPSISPLVLSSSSQVPQPTQEVTFMAVGEPDYSSVQATCPALAHGPLLKPLFPIEQVQYGDGSHARIAKNTLECKYLDGQYLARTFPY